MAQVDTPLRELGWALSGKDNGTHPMAWKHIANMISGYTRAEAPGAGWAYNDLAIELFKDSLEKLYGQSVNASFQQRLAPHMQVNTRARAHTHKLAFSLSLFFSLCVSRALSRPLPAYARARACISVCASAGARVHTVRRRAIHGRQGMVRLQPS